MSKFGRNQWPVVVVFFFLCQGTALPQAQKGVEVQVVNYADLVDLVNKHRGQVVVVDFWATFCPPCIQALPKIAQMHKQFAPLGLVAISVSLDQIKKDPQIKQNVLKQLQKADSRMINVILDEDFALAQKKLRFVGPPCVFVFNRQGKWVEFKEKQFSHDLIEQTVIQFLKEK